MIKNIIVSIVVLLVLDIAWLYMYMGSQYSVMVKEIQNSDIVMNKLYGALAYFCMSIGLMFFVIRMIYLDYKKNNGDTLKDMALSKKIKYALLYGGLFGFVLYGVYNFTAAAVFKNWSKKILIVDIMWGFFVYSVAAFVSLFV